MTIPIAKNAKTHGVETVRVTADNAAEETILGASRHKAETAAEKTPVISMIS